MGGGVRPKSVLSLWPILCVYRIWKSDLQGTDRLKKGDLGIRIV